MVTSLTPSLFTWTGTGTRSFNNCSLGPLFWELWVRPNHNSWFETFRLDPRPLRRRPCPERVPCPESSTSHRRVEWTLRSPTSRSETGTSSSPRNFPRRRYTLCAGTFLSEGRRLSSRLVPVWCIRLLRLWFGHYPDISVSKVDPTVVPWHGSSTDRHG